MKTTVKTNKTITITIDRKSTSDLFATVWVNKAQTGWNKYSAWWGAEKVKA